MKLSELVEGVSGATVRGDPGTEIRGLAYHTRDVADGTLFFCVPGLSFDGHTFAAAAVEAGAAALVCERDTGVSRAAGHRPLGAARHGAHGRALVRRPFARAPRRRRHRAPTARRPRRTSSPACSPRRGSPSGLLGTVVNRIGGVEHPVKLTTAESLDLQRMFREMLDAGDEACAFEVSSHALSQDRAAGIDFDAVVFSNLTRDHLDYHKDLEDYFGAKRRLFLPDERAQRPRRGDRQRRRRVRRAAWRDECAPHYGDDLWTCAVDEAAASGADGRRPRPRAARRRLRLHARLPAPRARRARHAAPGGALQRRERRGRGGGRPGPRPAASRPCLRGLAVTEGVPGRFQAVRAGQPFSVVVDYSHTPDSLENALKAARAVTAGRVLVVFGCGGDRDRGKRPLMGGIGARLADRSVITSDNPRTEEPLAIIDEIAAGVPAGAARPGSSSSRTAARPSASPSPRPGRATPSSSPARGTSRGSSSATTRSPSTTARSPRRSSPACAGDW